MKPYYQDSAVTIYHGDCMGMLQHIEAGVVVSDPPYGISDAPLQGNRGDTNTWHPPSTWDVELPNFSLLPRVPTALFGHWRKRTAVEALMATPIRAEIIWVKDTHVGFPCPVAMRDERIWIFSPSKIIGRRFETSVWESPIIPTWDHKHHKNEKPLDLMIRLVSWMPDGTILDPFMGSGTTLRAAKDLGRKAIGIEIEERYCEIAAKRMAQEVLFTEATE